MANTNTRQTNRKPVTLKIKFKSGTLNEFIERYAVDISQGGIFIRTKDPLPVGTTLKFAFLLKDATPLIAGDGTVVWNRAHDPARTGISPGMGVRFDKLSNNSQSTLDEVLARKSGSTTDSESDSNAEVLPSNGEFEDENDSDPAGDFVDSPTRVAPAGLVESLRATEFDEDDDTPLPQPMPFHGDESEFDESAFSESTRVVGVEQLLASAANSDAMATPDSAKAPKPDRASTSIAINDYEDPFGDLNEGADKTGPAPALDLLSDFESSTSMASRAASKKPEPNAVVETSSKTTSDTRSLAGIAAEEESSKVTIPKTSTVQEAVRDDGGGSSMGWVAAAAVILLIAGVGGFWFLNKDKKKDAKGPTNETVPLVAVAPDAAQIVPPEVSLDAAVPLNTQSVTIGVVPDGATVAVNGTTLNMPAPATFDLEEGKSFTITIAHSEFLAQSMEIVADGSEISIVELVPKPKLLRLTSVPAGASVILNGLRIKGKTPMEIAITPKQLRRNTMRLQMRLAKYKPLMNTFSLTDNEWESGEESMLKEFEFPLIAIPVRQPRNPRIPNNPTVKDDPVKDDPVKDDPVKDDPVKDPTGDIKSPSNGETKPDKLDTKPPKETGGEEPTPDWMQ